MRLDLKQVAREPGAILPFSEDLDLSDLDWNGVSCFTQPIHVEGQVRNMAGALLLTASLHTVLSLVCDRCAKPFTREKTVSYETLLDFELANGESDDIVLLDEDGTLELDGLMRDTFLLEMDTKNLCAEDCKGICPGCGVDLNVEPCRCKREPDPRLAKLAQLLQSEDR